MNLFRHWASWAAVTALLLTCASLEAAPNLGAAPEDPFALLPDDTKAVITINVRQVLDSALLKKSGALERLQEELKKDDNATKVMGNLGFNPLKDLDSVIYAVGGDKKDHKELVIFKGKFDVKKFEQHASALAKEKHDHIGIEKVPDGRGGSYTIYSLSKLDEMLPLPAEIPEPAREALGKKVFIGLDSSALLVSSGQNSVVDALAKAAGHKTSAIKEEKLKALLAKTDTKQSLALVILTKALLNDSGGAGPAKELQNLEDIRGGISVTDEIKAGFHLDAKDADSAKEIKNTLEEHLDQGKNAVTMLSAQMEALKPFATLLEGIKTEVKDKTVTIKSTINRDLLDNLASSVRELMRMVPAK
jgi:hypothetical protein